MQNVISKDGTKIAFEKTGQGPAVIMVNGAMGYREFHGGRDLVAELSSAFTVYIYDRRGRGESSDILPYAVEREIEDIEALIDEAGGSAYLYGVSSGAALALRAAAKLGRAKVAKLALYEPPYGSSDDKAKQDFAEQRKGLSQLIKDGKRGDAAAFFISSMGTPPEVLEGIRKSPDWKIMEGVEHTLAYDYAVLGDGAVPIEIAKAATMPALVMDGSKSFDFMHDAAETLGKVMPHAERKPLKNQTHEVSPDAIAPVLVEFFNSAARDNRHMTG
jgi:pimeloyl-ACP methyl ester carboxylesterase